MNKELFHKLLDSKGFLVSDGATGTNLIARGMKSGQTAELWVLEKPEEITKLHADFIASGADIILTSTFGASKIRLKQSGLIDRFKDINEAAVKIARKAANNSGTLIAGSMCPLGKMIKPLGTLDLDVAQDNYATQAEIIIECGVDMILIETQFDLTEAIAAIQGVRSVSDIALICSFSYDRGTKTMMGVSPTKFADAMKPYDLAALGINCGKSLDDNLKCLVELSNVTEIPIWFKPNAGLPEIDANGNAVYSVSPMEMGTHVKDWIINGAKIIGGCCGTSPEHLKSIASAVKTYIQ